MSPPDTYLPRSLRHSGRIGSVAGEGLSPGSPSPGSPCSRLTALRPLSTRSSDSQPSPTSLFICSSIPASASSPTSPILAASYLMPRSTEFLLSMFSSSTLRLCPVPTLLFEFEPGNRGAVDLVGAVGEAQGAGARPEVGEREVIRDPCAPVGLYSPVEHVQGHVGCDDFDHGDLRPGLFVAYRIHHVGRFQGQKARLLYLHPGVRDPGLHDTLLRKRLPERLPSFDPLAHHLERPLCDAYEPHAVVDAPRPEAPLGDGEALALVPDDVLFRYAHVVEGDLRVPVRGVVVAEDGEGPLYLYARRIERDQDHGLLLVARRLGVRLAHEDGDLAPRVPGTRDPPLPAVHHVLVPVPLYARPDIGRVRGGHIGLGHREAGPYLAVEQRPQPLLFLLRGAVAYENFHVAGVGGVAVENLGSHGAAAHDLAQGCVLQVREAGAEIRVGQEEVPQPPSLRLLLELLHDPGHGPPAPRSPELLVELRLVRVDELVHELLDPRPKPPRFLGELEVHNLSSH